MKALKTPVFIISLSLFILHQVLQKGFKFYLPWADSYLDNLLAMPVILSLLHAEKIILFKKDKSYALSLDEIILATIYVSFITEFVFPLLSVNWKTDWWDFGFYFAGSILYYLFRPKESFIKKGSFINKKRLNSQP